MKLRDSYGQMQSEGCPDPRSASTLPSMAQGIKGMKKNISSISKEYQLISPQGRQNRFFYLGININIIKKD
jgi:hypothetical protein